MVSLSQKPTSSCLRLPGMALLYIVARIALFTMYHWVFFYSYHLPCVCLHDNPAIRSLCSAFSTTYRLTARGWRRCFYSFPAWAKRSTQLYLPNIAKHFRDAMCILYAFFLGQNIGGSRFDRILSFTSFFWSFCSCEILPCSSETDQACGNWTRQCRWRDFPSIGHYATTMPWWQSQTMKSEIWCSTNRFLPFKLISKDCTHGKDKEFNFLIHLHQVVQVDPGMTGKESSSWMAVFPP